MTDIRIPITASQAAAEGVSAGKPTSQIIAENPQFKPNTLSVLASRVRKEMQRNVRMAPGRPVQLPEHIHDMLALEALCRGDRSANDLALRILSIVVSDNLYDAILDESTTAQGAAA